MARRTFRRAPSLRRADPTRDGSAVVESVAVVVAAVVASVVGVMSSAPAARGDGGGVTSVTCHASACHLAAQSRRTTQPGSAPTPRLNADSGSSGGLGDVARHFANDAAACLPLGALAPACMAARVAAMFGGGTPPGGTRPSPVVLARRAAARLELPRPVMYASPAWGRLLVGLPTWLWLDAASWNERSASASVPGVSVTARAVPTRVVWVTGDGGRAVCHGPGTPWRPGASAGSSSPTCGYTYPRPSAGQPDGRFAVRATIAWSVRWSGAGQSGDLPGMSTSASAGARVAESQALNGSAAVTTQRLPARGHPVQEPPVQELPARELSAPGLVMRVVGRCGRGCVG